jgi:hypothetical protein
MSFRELEKFQKDMKDKLVAETKQIFRRKHEQLLTPVTPVIKMIHEALKAFNDISTSLEDARKSYWFFTKKQETRDNLVRLAVDLFDGVLESFSDTLNSTVSEEFEVFFSKLK